MYMADEKNRSDKYEGSLDKYSRNADKNIRRAMQGKQ
jgi:hypothetical protein